VNLHDAFLQSNSTLVFSVTQRHEEDSGETVTVTYSNEDRPTWSKYSKILKWDMSKYVLALSDDVLVEFYEKTLSGNKVKLFQFWFNTRMAELKYLENSDDLEPRLILEKKELDKASKDTKHKDYAPDFKVELVFALTCSSGVMKSQELDEKSDVAPKSPTRKLPPPLPASYSMKKSLLSDIENWDKKITVSVPDPTLSHSHSSNDILPSDPPTNSKTISVSTATTNEESVGELPDTSQVPASLTVELPEPTSPVPTKMPDPSDDGLEEHFSLAEPTPTSVEDTGPEFSFPIPQLPPSPPSPSLDPFLTPPPLPEDNPPDDASLFESDVSVSLGDSQASSSSQPEAFPSDEHDQVGSSDVSESSVTTNPVEPVHEATEVPVFVEDTQTLVTDNSEISSSDSPPPTEGQSSIEANSNSNDETADIKSKYSVETNYKTQPPPVERILTGEHASTPEQNAVSEPLVANSLALATFSDVFRIQLLLP